MTRTLIAFAFALAAAPAFAQTADAVLVLADDGALDAPAVHAIRNVAASELRRHGIAVSGDPRTEGTRAVDASLSTLAVQLGAHRLFALRVGGQLGQKIPLSLEELSPGTLSPVHAASLTALGLEECDVVTARLVEAVVERRSAESTAQLRTVTAAESRPFAKKPGERFWFIGLPVALYGSGTPAGFTLGYGYEADNFRVNATAGGFGKSGTGSSDDTIGFLTLEAAWIPLEGEWSPYLGGGLGYMGSHGAGMGGVLEAGFEAFRLHGVRGLAGLQMLVPFFDTSHVDYGWNPATNTDTQTRVAGRTIYPSAFVRLAF